jgi:hypothetical protein
MMKSHVAYLMAARKKREGGKERDRERERD